MADIELGGNISLAGFSGIDGASMEVVRKVVGHWVKKETSQRWGFQGLRVTMKPVHRREKSEMYELHAHLLARGRKFNAEYTDRNLFMALDEVLKKIKHEVEHSFRD
jgi:ribosome-associated translation inhibitor RaiA